MQLQSWTKCQVPIYMKTSLLTAFRRVNKIRLSTNLVSASGVLVQADESIMAIIKKTNDQNNHMYILEDLGDKACLVKAEVLAELEYKVKQVYSPPCFMTSFHLTYQ